MVNVKLRNARAAARMTLEQLSREVGISASQLCRIEQGQREPKVGDVQRIAQSLGVAPNEIVHGLDLDSRVDPPSELILAACDASLNAVFHEALAANISGAIRAGLRMAQDHLPGFQPEDTLKIVVLSTVSDLVRAAVAECDGGLEPLFRPGLLHSVPPPPKTRGNGHNYRP